MEPFILVLLTIIFSACLLLLFSGRRPANLPPGPPPLPLIGNILQVGPNPHQSFAQFAKTYGPIIYLKFGTIDTVVVSSPATAKQVLQKHDHVLSSRPHPAMSDSYAHNQISLIWQPTNSRWRTLRRICKDHMFTLHRLDSGRDLRREKLHKLRDFLDHQCLAGGGAAVNVADATFTTVLNMLSSTLFSIDFADYRSEVSEDFKGLVHGLMEVVGQPNVADYFPVLKAVDPQGLKRKTTTYVRKLFGVFEDIIEKRVKSRSDDHGGAGAGAGDLLESLLEVSRKSDSDKEFTREDILHLLMDLFVAGIDTTSTIIEWTMAELIRNPDVMTTARHELDTVIGPNKEVEESDISKLPYLQAIIKESFRLHPPGPLLVPHQAAADVDVDGYVIPTKAQVLVNIWAMGRDPGIWVDPDHFNPERFLGSKIDVKGQDFELLPFGSGRRICPGLPLAHRVAHMMVTLMIRGYDWKLPEGIEPQELNMDEKFEFSLQRATPLEAIPVKI
ncbi:cytochrome P450 76T24-like [Andrographis paniculata]|uniref:cytochrome P450 76T24-like n=1 Tax=Andrographis paniculata TaxID=175694 RepID=UPI0021E7C652|nr:cytochrome P450 76T24-like [Andrographis paniculata]